VTEQLQKRFGEDVAGLDREHQIIVGSERDLPWVPPSALSVAVDADSLLLAPHYRAEEDALRLLVRVAATVARGRGQRCLIQTAQPEHRVLTALRHGHPLGCLNELSGERERDHLPPAAELLAVEVGSDATERHRELTEVCADGIQLHGPELGGERTRWFIQGASLQPTRVQLRAVVQRWRDAGLKVRIDADPIDL
jgi:primosomal protein N'